MSEINVPANVFVHCPKIGFKLRSVARNCPTCEHSRGLVVLMTRDASAPQLPFEKTYSIRCAHPVTRALHVVDVEG